MDQMNLDTYIDFYFLQSMIAEPPDLMKKSGELLWTDIQELNNHLIDKMTEVILQYTFIAACGEARHGYHGPGTFIPELPVGGHRSVACAASTGFAPDEHNFTVLSKLFAAKWHGGYGGPKWKNIANAGTMYATNKLDKVSFIDHCADLEHNGGCYFNKSSAGDLSKLYLHFASGTFKGFLSHKHSAPSMLTYDWAHQYGGLRFGSEVRMLMHRYYVVTKNEQPPMWVGVGQKTDYAKFEPNKMGTGVFSEPVKFQMSVHGSAMEQAQMKANAGGLKKAYANQYEGNNFYEEEVEKVVPSRSKEETAKEYWDEQSKPIAVTELTDADKPVSHREYTSISIA